MASEMLYSSLLVISLKACVSSLEKWKAFKEDYGVLSSRLERLTDKLSYEMMVPLNSVAFTPDCEIKIQELIKEQKLLESWLKETSKIKEESHECVEIVEEFDEEKERKWREQHAIRAKASKSKEKAAHFMEDIDIWKLLDNLEEEEKQKNTNLAASVHADSQLPAKSGKQVAWSDMEYDTGTIFVPIEHSDVLPVALHDSICSPADLYQQFLQQSKFQAISILKPMQVSSASHYQCKEKSTHQNKCKTFEAVAKDVVERRDVAVTSQHSCPQERPLSKFKASRKNR